MHLSRHAWLRGAQGPAFACCPLCVPCAVRIEQGGTLNLNAMPFQLPICPASYHGGGLRDEQWEAHMAQYGMWTGNTWWMNDPCTWWYTIVVELDVPNTSFDLRKEFPFVVASVPILVPYVIPPEVIAMAQPVVANAGPLEDGFYGGGDDDQPPVGLPNGVRAAVPLEAMYAEGGGMVPQMQWAPPQANVSVDFSRGYEGIQRNPCQDEHYAPAFPVAVAVMPALSESDAAVVNMVSPAMAAPPQVEVMVRPG